MPACHLGLAACGVLHHGFSQRRAGGEAVEEGGDDVTESDGQHLLVWTHRVAVLLGEHLGQRHSEGKTTNKTEETVK